MSDNLIAEGSRLSELPHGDSETQLIYGSPGAGKTRYAGTAGDRNLFINTGGGIATLQSPEFKKNIGCNPFVITIVEDTDSHGIVETATAFDKIGYTLEHWFDKKLNEFDVVTIDDLTAVSQFAANKAMELGGRLRGSRSLATAKSGRHIPIKEMGDWGIEMDALRHFLSTITRECKTHHKHLICTAHQRKYFTKASGSPEPVLKMIAPLLSGKDAFAPEVVPAMFDDVWHFTSVASGETIETHARTKPNAVVIARTRFGGVFKTDEVNPNFQKVISRIKGATQ